MLHNAIYLNWFDIVFNIGQGHLNWREKSSRKRAPPQLSESSSAEIEVGLERTDLWSPAGYWTVTTIVYFVAHEAHAYRSQEDATKSASFRVVRKRGDKLEGRLYRSQLGTKVKLFFLTQVPQVKIEISKPTRARSAPEVAPCEQKERLKQQKEHSAEAGPFELHKMPSMTLMLYYFWHYSRKIQKPESFTTLTEQTFRGGIFLEPGTLTTSDESGMFDDYETLETVSSRERTFLRTPTECVIGSLWFLV
ncbi:hypothetical protein HPB48_016099 [Haemaphysalis longicornis]|uniref:Uncharacterized protein n=1 Tax=Haemaphysalis longicornis TaxID=44386 RepID=A0A9J6GY13_HAELO|nr:hypothetical protein HPB48_016099 [Haemaphysalis longicornis]